MLKIGQQEIDALTEVIHSGKMFRYDPEGVCGRFEQRYADFLGIRYVTLCTSGTAALTAALAGLEIGPGDEVIVPAHTYMATALAVLAVGAIPIIVDIDESITLNPKAFREAIGPRTKAVIPVHMWGALCDMEKILQIANERGLLLVEDACQCVGGFYKGQAAGTMGQAGGFSFNYYKNISAGEGGCVVTNDDRVYRRASCMIDPCSFYWEGRDDAIRPFAASGSRASEFQGAILNVQLDRLPGLLDTLRQNKAWLLEASAETGLKPTPRHSPEGECATSLMYLLPSAKAAEIFAEAVDGTILLNTGRHTYTEWDPILDRQGSHHPALNPFDLPQNALCRKDYSRDMCPTSLDVLGRTVSIGLNPDQTQQDLENLAAKIKAAASALVQ